MMLVSSLLFVSVAGAASPTFSEETYQQAFVSWSKTYHKKYDVGEFFSRYQAFKSNADFVAKHNMGGHSYSVVLNEFADMRNNEFRRVYMGFVQKPRNGPVRTANLTGKAPASVDWISKGAVTPVKNQGQCGSCWSFSTTGSIEGSNFLVNGELKSFSEQQLVDCAGSYGNMGCNGGLMDNAFKYVESNGLCTEASYPYTAQDGTCKASSCQKAVTVATYSDVPSEDLDSLASAVAQQPVSIAVDAAGSGWQLYRGGIFDSSCGTQLDHGVLIVGYTSEYWLVKNSWGATWGENGYIKLPRTTGRGAGTCGLALQASYPTVASLK